MKYRSILLIAIFLLIVVVFLIFSIRNTIEEEWVELQSGYGYGYDSFILESEIGTPVDYNFNARNITINFTQLNTSE